MNEENLTEKQAKAKAAIIALHDIGGYALREEITVAVAFAENEVVGWRELIEMLADGAGLVVSFDEHADTVTVTVKE